MHACRRQYLGYNEQNLQGNNNQENDSQAILCSNSDEHVLDNIFLTTSGNQYYKNKKNGSSYKNNYSRILPLSQNITHQYFNHNWSSRFYALNNINGTRATYESDYKSSNKRDIRNNGTELHGYSDNYFHYTNKNSNNFSNINNRNLDNSKEDWKQVVDQRGFPEKSGVIALLTQSMQDLELRDFIEESVIECYHYLSAKNQQDNCQFSHNLISCLNEKCSEICDDWSQY